MYSEARPVELLTDPPKEGPLRKGLSESIVTHDSEFCGETHGSGLACAVVDCIVLMDDALRMHKQSRKVSVRVLGGKSS